MIRKLLALLAFALLCGTASATATCTGTIKAVMKWSTATTLSTQVLMTSGYTRWFTLPSKSDEAQALTALATGLPVTVAWTASDVTTCTAGWTDNRTLDGWLAIGTF